MIIKLQVSYGHSMWQIIEDARGVMFSEEGKETSPSDFINTPKNHDEYYEVWHSRPNPSLIGTFNYIAFTHENIRRHLLFDGTAYICNDEGKTIQRLLHRPHNIVVTDNKPV